MSINEMGSDLLSPVAVMDDFSCTGIIHTISKVVGYALFTVEIEYKTVDRQADPRLPCRKTFRPKGDLVVLHVLHIDSLFTVGPFGYCI